MIRYFIYFLFILAITNKISLAQNKLLGKITDKQSGKALVGVNISIENHLTLGCVTNNSGFYEIDNIPKGENIISISSVGYCLFKDTVNINSFLCEKNYELENQLRTINLSYPEAYKLYHKKFQTDSGYLSLVTLNVEIDKSKSDDIIFVYPIIKNAYDEPIYLPDRIHLFKVWINDEEFDSIETAHRFGCPIHFYNKIYEEQEIIEINSGDTKRIAGFYILKKDLSKFKGKHINIKLQYRYNLPKQIEVFECTESEIQKLEERYYKIFSLVLVSPKVEIIFK